MGYFHPFQMQSLLDRNMIYLHAHVTALSGELDRVKRNENDAQRKIHSLQWMIKFKDEECERAQSAEKVALASVVRVKNELVEELKRSEKFLIERDEAFGKLENALLQRNAAMKELERLKSLLKLQNGDSETNIHEKLDIISSNKK